MLRTRGNTITVAKSITRKGVSLRFLSLLTLRIMRNAISDAQNSTVKQKADTSSYTKCKPYVECKQPLNKHNCSSFSLSPFPFWALLEAH